MFVCFLGGKSAVVTALVVGLGGKASTTSRGSSIKNFVKTGKRFVDCGLFGQIFRAQIFKINAHTEEALGATRPYRETYFSHILPKVIFL